MQKVTEHIFEPSTLENIDYSIFEWLDKKMNIFVNTNEGFKKIPVQFVSPERSFLSKHSKEDRDNSGMLVFPKIVIERTGIHKEPVGNMGTNIPATRDFKGRSIEIARRIQQQKTSERANNTAYAKHSQINFPRKNEKIVYEIISIPQPTHLEISYQISIRTEYQLQMNDILAKFLNEHGNWRSFYLERNGHRYEAFMESDLSLDNNIKSMDKEERSFKTTIDIKVVGYIIGEGPNDEQPKIVIRETAAEFKIQRERSMLGDLPPHGKKGYRP